MLEQMKDNAVVLEGPWVTSLIVTLNNKRKPFDDLRVRQALTHAIDRWGGSASVSRISLMKHVGGFTRPGYELALAPAELEKLPGFWRDIDKAREEARRLLKEAGVGSLKILLLNRDTQQPYTPASVFVIDQWRRIGVEVEHKQIDPRAYYEAISRGDFDAAIDFVSDFSDDPNLHYIRLLSHGQSPVSYAQHSDKSLDELFEKQKRATSMAERKQLANRVRAGGPDRRLQHAAVLVAAHHRAPQEGERLEAAAEPQQRHGPDRGLARPVGGRASKAKPAVLRKRPEHRVRRFRVHCLLQALQLNPKNKRPLPWLAIAHLRLGQEDKGRDLIHEYMREFPSFSIGKWSSGWPFQSAAMTLRRERLLEALRALGVPERS